MINPLLNSPAHLKKKTNKFFFSIYETEDKKGGVDRSSTVVARDPEGNK